MMNAWQIRRRSLLKLVVLLLMLALTLAAVLALTTAPSSRGSLPSQEPGDGLWHEVGYETTKVV